MTEGFLLVVDYDSICRLCLQPASGMSDILEDNDENSLQKLVHRATGLEINPNNRLPSKICYRCRYLVELSCQLKDMVEKTQTLLPSSACSDNLDNIPSRDLEPMHAEETVTPQPQVFFNIQTDQTTYKRDQHLDLDAQDNLIRTPAEPETIMENETLMNNSLDLKSQNTDVLQSTINTRKENKKDGFSISKKRKVSPKQLTCQICLNPFTSVEQVESHLEIHYKDSNLTPYCKLQRPYHCEGCDQQVSKTQLISHHRRHLNVNPYVCTEPGCSFEGKNRDSLRHHNLKHGVPSKVCEECGAAFKRGFELVQHRIRSHDEQTAALCHSCGGSFRNILSLRQHALICKKSQRYLCEWTGCARAYGSRAALAAHGRAHAGGRAYRCHLCGVAAYASRSMLNRHLRQHSAARTWRCVRCAAQFADYGALYRHRAGAHGPWRPHRCNGCHRGYQTEANLEKHLLTCASTTSKNTVRKTRKSPITSIEDKKRLHTEVRR